ncbi:MAG: PspC domain-containing protein [Bacteroidia bacterium]|jgi:phage shock protein PspC (stress-responsive transcriptional regulator)
MNKVVNVNLGGYVLILDDSAYEQLKQYLERLTQHFAGKEGATEIIADIETRFAELLLQRIPDAAQAVSLDKVKDVIDLMGEPWQMDDEQKEPASTKTKERKEPTKLRRDPNSKVLGGVCSGIAAYLGLDTTLIRLLFAVSLFVFGTGFLLYIILWIAIPIGNSTDFQSDESTKKLYRDPDNATIGGVCSGLGHFFGIDAVWFKIAFLVSFFMFGGGFLLYIILWIAIPQAVSASDRLRMRGEPIDVSNIERVVSKTAAQAGKKLNKVGSFLTEMFTLVVSFLGKVIGFVLVVFGITLIIAWAVGMSYGNTAESNRLISFFMADEMVHQLSIWGISMIVITLGIMSILVGLRLWIRPAFKTRYLNIVSGIVMLAGWITLGCAIGQYVYSINDEGEETRHEEIPFPLRDTLYLSSGLPAEHIQSSGFSVGLDNHGLFAFETQHSDSVWIRNQRLTIEAGKAGYDLIRSAHAPSKTRAREFARLVNYNVHAHDSGFVFDDGFLLEQKDGFRFQDIHIQMFLPVRTIIIADQRVCDMLNLRGEHGIKSSRTLEVTQTGLVCLDCSQGETFHDRECTDEEKVSIMMHNKDDEEMDSVHITIQEGDDEIKVNKTKIRIKDGKRVKTTVRKTGPVTIKTTEEIEKEETE